MSQLWNTSAMESDNFRFIFNFTSSYSPTMDNTPSLFKPSYFYSRANDTYTIELNEYGTRSSL